MHNCCSYCASWLLCCLVYEFSSLSATLDETLLVEVIGAIVHMNESVADLLICYGMTFDVGTSIQ